MAMRLSRRRFLGLSLEAGVLLPTVVAEAHGTTLSSDVGTLRAYLDTLIPADEAPSATDLGVTEKLLGRADSDPAFRSAIEYGCAWLDRQAAASGGRRFAEVVPQHRERIVRLLSNTSPGSSARMFFDVTRDDVFFHYYADPRSWGAIDYAGPPQPKGFPDYSQPPRRAR